MFQRLAIELGLFFLGRLADLVVSGNSLESTLRCGYEAEQESIGTTTIEEVITWNEFDQEIIARSIFPLGATK